MNVWAVKPAGVLVRDAEKKSSGHGTPPLKRTLSAFHLVRLAGHNHRHRYLRADRTCNASACGTAVTMSFPLGAMVTAPQLAADLLHHHISAAFGQKRMFSSIELTRRIPRIGPSPIPDDHSQGRARTRTPSRTPRQEVQLANSGLSW